MPKIKPLDCTKAEFIKFIEQDLMHYGQERSIKKRFPKHYEIILKCPGGSFGEKLYCYVHDISVLPVCKMCGSQVKFASIISGFCKYCCNKCGTSDPDRVNKAKQTCLERYGVANPRQNPDVINKAKQTCLERYGVENPSQSQLIKDKKKRTTIEHYGVENPSQSAEVIAKIKQSHIDKYGEVNIGQANAKLKNPDIIRFVGRTWICKCPHPDCDKCTEKWYETRSMLYKNRRESGAELCTRLLPLQPTISTYELRIRGWLDEWGIEYLTSVRDVIDGELDIYIPSKNIAIEFNGTYHHRVVKKVETTGKLKDYHLIKFKKCLAKGIHLISIWQDEILYKEDACKKMLRNYLFARDPMCNIKPISGIMAQEFILSNFPDKYIKATHYIGIVDNQSLVGCFVGRETNISNGIEFEIFCSSKQQCVVAYQYIKMLLPNSTIKTNNDHISHQAMLDAGFKLKEIRLDEKIRTVNNRGSYPTYNSGTSIWTI